MGRPARIQYPGACYLITLDGNNRQDIFISHQDRRHFLLLVKSYKERSGLKVYAYCLLNNQARLLIQTLRPNLSAVMQGLNTVYTKYFNREHNTVGHLFQGRYKAVLVDPETSLMEATFQVHLAPMRSGPKEKPWRNAWSSCSAYVESAGRGSVVDTEDVLRPFGKNRLKQSVKYLQLLKERMKSSKSPSGRRGWTLGSPTFAARMAQIALGASGSAQARGEQEAAAQEKARAILAEIAARGVTEQDLAGRDHREGMERARKEAAYRLWKEAGLGPSAIGRMLKRTPSAISQLVHSVEKPNPAASGSGGGF